MVNQRPVRPSSSQAISSSSSSPSQKTAASLRQQVIGYVQDTIAVVGGSWALNAPPGSPAWNPDTAQYIGGQCQGSGPKNSQDFAQHVYGAPSADPKALTAKVADHWKSLGYTVRTVVSNQTQAGANDFTEIAAEVPNGARLGFTASQLVTIIEVHSECSTDPSLDTKTK